jgi:biopolymer transport protein ExbB/TolQ
MLNSPDERTGKNEALDASQRASARSAALVHREMKRGLNSLATIASTAAWIGLFGTVLGIVNAFPASGANKVAIMAVIFDRLSQSFAPTAFGLVVAVAAMWCYKYLRAEVDAFDLEMKNAVLQLTNDLSARPG